MQSYTCLPRCGTRPPGGGAMWSEMPGMGSDESRALVAALGRVHQQLLQASNALWTRLEGRPHYAGAHDDVCGYAVPSGQAALGEPERGAMLAQLTADLWRLQQMTAQLEQLQAWLPPGV